MSFPRKLILTMISALGLAVPAALTAAELPMASPESVGVSSERLERLDAAMQRYIDAELLAGTVSLIARDGKVIHVNSQCWRDKENDEPMTDDAIFFIMSMTKPIFSTALMML